MSNLDEEAIDRVSRRQSIEAKAESDDRVLEFPRHRVNSQIPL